MKINWRRVLGCTIRNGLLACAWLLISRWFYTVSPEATLLAMCLTFPIAFAWQVGKELQRTGSLRP